jgi:hypothetical protein
MAALIELSSAAYSGAMAYTNIINVAGYAAILAIWNFTKDYSSPLTAQYVATLLVLSLGFFVGFEICRMFINSIEMQTFGRAVDAHVKAGAQPSALMKSIEEYQTGNARLMI